MIFQDPLSALHPYYTVGAQIIEAYRVHNNVSKKAARGRAIEMLDRVGIPQPDRRVDDYPHQFSGGMRQRAMIAMGLINNPGLLIADEPTTALDVTVQAQILDLLQDLQREFNSAIIIITHDLGVIAEMADDVLVMYAGRAVEYGPTKEILTHPEMPYTWGLLSSVPDVSRRHRRPADPDPGQPAQPAQPAVRAAPSTRAARTRTRCPATCAGPTMPELVPGNRGPGHLKRCHLVDPEPIYLTEILPEIAPDLVDEIVDAARDRGSRRRPRRGLSPTGRAPVTRPDVAARRSDGAEATTPILEVDNLRMYFPVKSSGLIRRTVGHVQAVDGVRSRSRGRFARPGR